MLLRLLLLLLLLIWRWAGVSLWSRAHCRAVCGSTVSIRFVCALMQSDLVIASDRNFNLIAGIAEEVLGIVVGQIASIVLVDFGNDIATQKFLLCRAVYLNLKERENETKRDTLINLSFERRG